MVRTLATDHLIEAEPEEVGLSSAGLQRLSRLVQGHIDQRRLPGAISMVARRGKVLFVNDSKATNADSAAQALACFNDIFWIAGGRPKAGGISGLSRFFPRIAKAYLIGEAAAEFAATLAGHVPYAMAGTLDRAVAMAASDAEESNVKEPVVLLSPACASFDQFSNFEVRGAAFRELVLKLGGVEPVREGG